MGCRLTWLSDGSVTQGRSLPGDQTGQRRRREVWGWTQVGVGRQLMKFQVGCGQESSRENSSLLSCPHARRKCQGWGVFNIHPSHTQDHFALEKAGLRMRTPGKQR
jgi:hypothetical protein